MWVWLLHQRFIPLQPSSFKYWTPNLQFVIPIPHLRPLSADPSPLITAKFISRDRQSLKGRADWSESIPSCCISPYHRCKASAICLLTATGWQLLCEEKENYGASF